MHFCECEFQDCKVHEHDKGNVATQPVKTVFGTFQICAECAKQHPIPSNFLTNA